MPSIEFPDKNKDDVRPNSRIPLVVIVGPTAVGKSEIAIKLAERFDGEIVSADSRLFYRGMDIGTAKPTLDERKHVPHHLIDVADPDESWSVAIFQREARKAILGIHLMHHLPFLVGGTGQFIRAITEGWDIPSVLPNPRLRGIFTQSAERLGAAQIHAWLASLDPQAAKSIDPSNTRRTVRALEVIYSTGKRFSEQRKRGEIAYNVLMLGLTCPRSELYRRIDERISRMVSTGFVEEVQRLLEKGYRAQLPTMSAIGYAEVVAYIQGKISLEGAIAQMKRRTRIFVRRQANWFKLDDERIAWFQANITTADEMGKTISQWLKTINRDDLEVKNPKTVKINHIFD